MTIDQALEVAEGMLWQKVPATIDLQLFAQRLIARLESEPPVVEPTVECANANEPYCWMLSTVEPIGTTPVSFKCYPQWDFTVPLYLHPPMNRAVIEQALKALTNRDPYAAKELNNDAIAALKALLGDEK